MAWNSYVKCIINYYGYWNMHAFLVACGTVGSVKPNNGLAAFKAGIDNLSNFPLVSIKYFWFWQMADYKLTKCILAVENVANILTLLLLWIILAHSTRRYRHCNIVDLLTCKTADCHPLFYHVLAVTKCFFKCWMLCYDLWVHECYIRYMLICQNMW